MMLLFQAFKLYSRYNAPLNKCAFSSEKYALLTRNTCFCQKSVLLVRICSYIATPMTMEHKVIKHPCLQISTPADLKTLQWVWARNKVTAYKAPLHTKNDQELKPFILKTLFGNIMSRGAYYMCDHKILDLNIEQSRSP